VTTLLCTTLPYQPDSLKLMEKFIDLPWPVFLDSGHTSEHENYPNHALDIIAANPSKRLISTEKHTQLAISGSAFETLDEELFSALRSRLPDTRPDLHPDTSVYPAAPGWIGCMSYDLCRQLETLPLTTINDLAIPDATFGFYDWVIATNHDTKTTRIIYLKDTDISDVQSRVSYNSATTSIKPFCLLSNFSSDQTRHSYEFGFRKIKNYIVAGDAYQINFAQRFSANYRGGSWHAYKILRENNPSPMGAFFATHEFELISLSPERFVSVVDNKLTTSPIKGTRPRTNDKRIDDANIQNLRQSTKDQAENLMIVDLLRNDFGKVCKPGTISVPALFDIESYPNVHHLVSTIQGTLDDKLDAIEAIKQCFPGGSITGAPKVRAMEIIDELERHRRTAYCGSTVYFNVVGACDSNINIRTFVLQDNTIHCWGGGGIVADSICSDEYQETFDKVGRYLKILEKHRH